MELKTRVKNFFSDGYKEMHRWFIINDLFFKLGEMKKMK